MTGSGHKYSILVSIIVLMMLGGLAAWLIIERQPDTRMITVDNHVIEVEIADDQMERARGLSGRENLGRDSGMLFTFGQGENTCIWMKEMNFSLDILWFNADGLLIDSRADVAPETFPNSFCPSGQARYVLELPAGSLERLGLKINASRLKQ